MGSVIGLWLTASDDDLATFGDRDSAESVTPGLIGPTGRRGPLASEDVNDCGRVRVIWLIDQIEGELYGKGGAEVLEDAREEARRYADLLFPPRSDEGQETMPHLRMRLQILTQRLDHL